MAEVMTVIDFEDLGDWSGGSRFIHINHIFNPCIVIKVICYQSTMLIVLYPL